MRRSSSQTARTTDNVDLLGCRESADTLTTWLPANPPKSPACDFRIQPRLMAGAFFCLDTHQWCDLGRAIAAQSCATGRRQSSDTDLIAAAFWARITLWTNCYTNNQPALPER